MIVHPTSIIEKGVELGENVTIGAFTILHPGVQVGAGTNIGAFCELGIGSNNSNSDKLIIGRNSNIRSHTVAYLGSSFADGLETGHHVSLRENIEAGQNLRVGSYSDLQGDIVIGDFVRLHSNVHIGKKTSIGNFVWIFPYVVTTNDPVPPSNHVLGCTLEDYVVIATASIILPGVKIGHDSVIGANSTVTKDLEPFCLALGTPAKVVKDVREIRFNSEGPTVYPWRHHFFRGYPDYIVENWLREV